MNCEQAQAAINARIDREADEAEWTVLEAHLAVCGECREAAESMRSQDVDLLRAFQPNRARAARLADRVLSGLADDSLPTANRRPARVLGQRHSANWTSLLLATAIGFLLAVVVFQPWKAGEAPVKERDRPDVNVKRPAPVAQLAVATGEVEFSAGSDKAWQPVRDLASFACPSDGAVRTSDDVRCELVTADGCVIRLNGQTQVTFRSARSIELQRGQIWCRSPQDVTLEVTPPETDQPPVGAPAAAPQTNAGTPSAWSCTASTPASFLTSIGPDGAVQITTAGGEVSVRSGEGLCRLKTSETATIAGGRIDRDSSDDGLLSLSWMQPLLIRKGHADDELRERVDALLAGIGYTKMSTLYEQEIRSLGEHCVLPLIRYVQSPRSKQEPGRRLQAMRIVSDLAPSWAIGELIRLLDEEDPDVRVLSAAALERLTGQTQGCPAEDWWDPAPASEKARAEWDRWWEANRDRFPFPGDE